MTAFRPYDGPNRMLILAPFAAGGVLAFALTPLLTIERPALLAAAGAAFLAVLAALRWLPWPRLPTWAHAVPSCLGLVILGLGLLALSDDAVPFLPLTLGPPLFLALYGTRRHLAVCLVLASGVVVAAALGTGRFLQDFSDWIATGIAFGAAGGLLFFVQHLVASLRTQEERHRVLVDSLHEGVLYRDATGVRMANPAARRLLGLDDDKLYGRVPHGLTALRPDGSEWPSDEWPMETAARTGLPQLGQLMGIRREGATTWISVNALPAGDRSEAVIGSFADVTAELEAQAALERQASTDELTGLANRRRLLEHAELALAQSRRTLHATAVVWIDLDGFKSVNDELGHAVGDQVLREIAARLEGQTRPGDLLARFGGDEFALLMTDLGDGSTEAAEAAVRRVVERLSAEFAEPFGGERKLTISASFGVGVCPHDCDDLRELIEHADRDMYRNKAEKRREAAVVGGAGEAAGRV